MTNQPALFALPESTLPPALLCKSYPRCADFERDYIAETLAIVESELAACDDDDWPRLIDEAWRLRRLLGIDDE